MKVGIDDTAFEEKLRRRQRLREFETDKLAHIDARIRRCPFCDRRTLGPHQCVRPRKFYD